MSNQFDEDGDSNQFDEDGDSNQFDEYQPIDMFDIQDSEVEDVSKVGRSSKIALIDADTIVYATCSSLEDIVEILPKDFYTSLEWEEITKEPSYFEGATEIKYIDLEEAVRVVEEKLEYMLEAINCSDFELHFTMGKCFRYLLTDTYKANRDSSKVPSSIKAVKQLLVDKYPTKAFIHRAVEADDVVVSKYDSEKYILCAIDKDVLNSVAGTHWNYYSRPASDIEPKFVTTTAETASDWVFIQALMGDATDGIGGIYRVGIVKATKAIVNLHSRVDKILTVYSMYINAGMTIDDMCTTMNLVDMSVYDHSTTSITLHTLASLRERVLLSVNIPTVGDNILEQFLEDTQDA